ncbi:unnamed protein product [Rotaria sp. Silwood1]|nr:unnamed protein product [Rotaria sp. Silwood1]
MSKDIELPVRREGSRLVIPDVEDSKKVDPVIGYAEEPLLSLSEACIPLALLVHNLMAYVSIALEHTPMDPEHGLTRDESAAICLYTMEWNDEHRSFYSILNETLRIADHENLRPWFKYLKLFLTDVIKIPCIDQQTVWRGIRADLSLQFPQGTPVIWWGFSSCTSMLPVLENDLYLGYQGPRTLFSIDAINARNVRDHSFYRNEEEILLLPGTYMEVRSQLNPAPDLHIIHLKQKIPDKMLLEPPFEGRLKI